MSKVGGYPRTVVMSDDAYDMLKKIKRENDATWAEVFDAAATLLEKDGVKNDR